MRLIDADALLAKNEEEPMVWDNNDEYMLGRRNMWRDWVEDIKNTPTVDPIQHGYWIDRGDDYCVYCSECNDYFVLPTKIKYCHPIEVEGLYYCPTCGAKMEDFKSELD